MSCKGGNPGMNYFATFCNDALHLHMVDPALNSSYSTCNAFAYAIGRESGYKAYKQAKARKRLLCRRR